MPAWFSLRRAGLACAPAVAITAPVGAQVVQEHATGLRAPARLLSLPDGQLLVAEAGSGPNTGRESLVDRDGRRFTPLRAHPHGGSLRSGAASRWRIRRHTGDVERIAGGLQTAVDAWPLTGTGDLSYVLEYSQSFLTGGPGRLVMVDAARGTVLPMAEGLRTPTGLARDTRTGDLFVTEFGGNRIVRVLVPR